jgi:hypothetical protein
MALRWPVRTWARKLTGAPPKANGDLLFNEDLKTLTTDKHKWPRIRTFYPQISPIHADEFPEIQIGENSRNLRMFF